MHFVIVLTVTLFWLIVARWLLKRLQVKQTPDRLAVRELAGWSFSVSQTSPGCYCAKGVGPRHMTVEHNGTDHEEALERAKEYAAEMSRRSGLSNR